MLLLPREAIATTAVVVIAARKDKYLNQTSGCIYTSNQLQDLSAASLTTCCSDGAMDRLIGANTPQTSQIQRDYWSDIPHDWKDFFKKFMQDGFNVFQYQAHTRRELGPISVNENIKIYAKQNSHNFMICVKSSDQDFYKMCNTLGCMWTLLYAESIKMSDNQDIYCVCHSLGEKIMIVVTDKCITISTTKKDEDWFKGTRKAVMHSKVYDQCTENVMDHISQDLQWLVRGNMGAPLWEIAAGPLAIKNPNETFRSIHLQVDELSLSDVLKMIQRNITWMLQAADAGGVAADADGGSIGFSPSTAQGLCTPLLPKVALSLDRFLRE